MQTVEPLFKIAVDEIERLLSGKTPDTYNIKGFGTGITSGGAVVNLGNKSVIQELRVNRTPKSVM